MLLCLSTWQPAFAEKLYPGFLVAQNCLTCHSSGNHHGIPSLEGYSKEKFIETMKAFKSGERPATIMHRISQGLTDEELYELAQYFEQ